MGKPIRLQLSRRKGFDLQAVSIAANGLPAVNVARPSKWGNPWTVEGAVEAGYGSTPTCARWCVSLYRQWLRGSPSSITTMLEGGEVRRAVILRDMAHIRGKNLACWCRAGSPCHADILLEMANRPICEEVA